MPPITHAAGHSLSAVLTVTVSGLVAVDTYSPIKVKLGANNAWTSAITPNAVSDGFMHTYTIPLTGQSLDPNNNTLRNSGPQTLTVTFDEESSDDANPTVTATATLTVSGC